MNSTEKILKMVVRGCAVSMWLAIVAVFMPFSWMEKAHSAIGMGALPAGPIVEYMARSLSGLYVIMGIVVWICSFDLRKYSGMLLALLLSWTILSVSLIPYGLKMGMPAWWVVGDPVSLVIVTAFVIVLQRKLKS